MSDEPAYYDSQKQAAAALGIDESVLKDAKAEGCPAFKSGRIYKAALTEWLSVRTVSASPALPPAGSVNVETASVQEVKRLREIVGLKREMLALDEKRDALLPTAEYEAALGATVGHFRSALLAHPGRATGKIVLRVRAAVLNLLKALLTEKQFARIEPQVQDIPVDYADIEEVLDGEVDLILRTLQPCDHLAPDLKAE